jgi:cysteinyl-tRNA synthetase
MPFRGVIWYRESAELHEGFMPYLRAKVDDDVLVLEEAHSAVLRCTQDIRELCDYVEELQEEKEAYRKAAVGWRKKLAQYAEEEHESEGN